MVFKVGDEETICALSSASGIGGIAVIRVSGPDAFSLVRKLCGFLPETPESHRIYYGFLRSVGSAEALDEVLVSCFAQGRSFTGEETAEISCHGSKVIVSAILKELVEVGCRLADRGEFTYRAFMNGRLDLVQAESVLTLIESQSRQSARLSLRQLQGGLSKDFARVEDDLLWLLAQLEASIDFSAEGLEFVPSEVLLRRTQALLGFVGGLLDSYKKGRLVKEGLQVALVGKPNSGKSSLLNALLNEDRAIVAAEAGTTRDWVEGRLFIDGFPVTFVDTAGLRETENEIERAGIRRSREAIERADLVFYVIDPSAEGFGRTIGEFLELDSSRSCLIINKMDLPVVKHMRPEIERELMRLKLGAKSFWVSALRRTGLEQIESKLGEIVHEATDSQVSTEVTQARHFGLLRRIQACVRSAHDLIEEDSSPELIAFELQDAVRSIHELLGKAYDEQVIDRIFKEFCLGK